MYDVPVRAGDAHADGDSHTQRMQPDIARVSGGDRVLLLLRCFSMPAAGRAMLCARVRAPDSADSGGGDSLTFAWRVCWRLQRRRHHRHWRVDPRREDHPRQRQCQRMPGTSVRGERRGRLRELPVGGSQQRALRVFGTAPEPDGNIRVYDERRLR